MKFKLSSKNEEINELRRYFSTICNFYSGVTWSDFILAEATDANYSEVGPRNDANLAELQEV